MQTLLPALGAFVLSAVLALPAAQVSAPPAPNAPTAPKAPSAPKSPGSEQSGEASKSKTVKPAGYWYGTPKAPDRKKGAIRIAAFNVENLFDAVDDPSLQGEYDDIKMVTKPARVQALADAIKRLDADVLCIEEIESLDALKWFRDNYLKGLGYDHVYSEDVGYYRGVEQACLSRFPIKSHATFVQEDLSDMDGKRDGQGWAAKKPDQGKTFQRSPLRVDIDVNGYPLTIFSVHLKAGGKEFEFQRESEALQLIDFVQQAMRENPEANIAVMGDFNATPSQKTAKAFTEAGLRTAYDFRGVKKGNTKDLYTTHDSGRAIDFIFMSPGLAKDAVDGGFFVLSVTHPASDYDWRKDPEKEKVPAGYASDHCPVAIDIMPKDSANGAPAGKPVGKAPAADD